MEDLIGIDEDDIDMCPSMAPTDLEHFTRQLVQLQPGMMVAPPGPPSQPAQIFQRPQPPRQQIHVKPRDMIYSSDRSAEPEPEPQAQVDFSFTAPFASPKPAAAPSPDTGGQWFWEDGGGGGW